MSHANENESVDETLDRAEDVFRTLSEICGEFERLFGRDVADGAEFRAWLAARRQIKARDRAFGWRGP